MQINSNKLNATFNTLGAELKSLKLKDKEILWQTKDNFWPHSAPILFPFCGFLKNGFYTYKGKSYKVPVHGFAKCSDFKIESIDQSKVTFTLADNEETRKLYPFDFKLSVSYEIIETQLRVKFKVENTSKKTTLPCSIGWHPGFNLTENSYIKLTQFELKKRQVSIEGLIGKEEKLKLENGILSLDQNTFKNGGIVIQEYSSEISLHTEAYQINLNFEDFPNLVLWSQPGADFVCIEPWFGMGDTIKHKSNFLKKESLILLDPGKDKTLNLSLQINA